jgi:hypothetical protein
MIPIKNQYSLSMDDFSDSFIIGYDPGSMGDFFSSVLMMSYYIKTNICMPDAGSTNRYVYSSETKKWVVNDSIDSGLRFFTSKDDHDNCVKKYGLTSSPYMNTNLELRHSLMTMSKFYPDKLKRIPYFFVSENLGSYLYGKPKQSIKQGNLIYVYMSDQPNMIKNILRFYKNHMWIKFYKGQNFFLSKQQFVDNVTHDMTHNPSHKLQMIDTSDLKNFVKFDIDKLLFNDDTQGLDIIDTNHPFIANMISITKNDVTAILKFYGYTINSAKKLKIADAGKVYDKLTQRHAQHKY